MAYANNLSAVVEDFLFRLAPGPNAKELDDVQKRKGSRQFPERFKSLKGSLADAEKGNVEDVRLKCLLENTNVEQGNLLTDPYKYSEGMAADQKDRYIQYLAEQNQNLRLPRNAQN